MNSKENAEVEEIIFALTTETAIEFISAHICAASARRLVNYAASGEHETDPDEFLHLARIEAAEAQHHIGRATKAAQKDNTGMAVLNTLGPLFTELELKLDAIRYRAHTSSLDHPYWGLDLELRVDGLPEHIRTALSDDDVDDRVVAVERESHEPENVSVVVGRYENPAASLRDRMKDWFPRAEGN